MTSTGGAGGIGQSQLDIRPHKKHASPLPVPIGTSQLISSHSRRATTSSKADGRVVKPWAHLVAGGCVFLVANA